ncbi:MAG: phenylalanine--tRNA ligase subunit beta, partial [Parachlamydiaceae bacterium]
MKFPLSWLKESIDLDQSAAEIAKVLTSLGIEVDSVKEAEDQEVVFEVSLTPNLGHCASMLGIARELSAALEKPICFPRAHVKETGAKIDSQVTVRVEDKARSPRYACRLVKGVKVAASPEWMQKKLLACGIRPINTIVDITNYVLLESGQPLHAFDFDKLEGATVVVRTAREGESIVTLDGHERTLNAADLVICDQKQPVAIAGVMGGLNSEVDEKTRNVLIEAAHFAPSSIRRTSKHLGLQTDASRRFERSVDPHGVLEALDRAAQLMHELAQGEIAVGSLDIKESEFPMHHVSCRLSRINSILGIQLGVNEVENILKRLDFSVHWDGRNTFALKIPTYRADIKEEIDIIEEVARVYGYDNIVADSSRYHGSTLPNAPIFVFENQARDRLLAEGLQEFLTCDLIGPTFSAIAKEAIMPESATVHVLNPTSIEQSILRTSLLPGLLQVVKYNASHQNVNIAGFEIGRIHFKDKEDYKEQSMVGIILTGQSRFHHWKQKPEDFDFFDLKGIVESFLDLMGVKGMTLKNNQLPSLHPGRQASVYVGPLEIGSFGEVHPSIVQRLDVPQRIFFGELNLHDLYKVHDKS